MSAVATDPRTVAFEELADLVTRRLVGRTVSTRETERVIHEEFPGYDLTPRSISHIVDIIQTREANAAAARQTATTVIAALYDVARALREAGKTREEADESLRTTTNVAYHGHVTDVIREVYRPAAMLDLQSLIDDYQGIEVPEFGFEDREEGAEYEQAEARAGLAGRVMDAIAAIAADWRAGAAKIRPQDGDDFATDDGEEVADAIADVYDECATTLLQAFGLPTDEEA